MMLRRSVSHQLRHCFTSQALLHNSQSSYDGQHCRSTTAHQLLASRSLKISSSLILTCACVAGLRIPVPPSKQLVFPSSVTLTRPKTHQLSAAQRTMNVRQICSFPMAENSSPSQREMLKSLSWHPSQNVSRPETPPRLDAVYLHQRNRGEEKQ